MANVVNQPLTLTPYLQFVAFMEGYTSFLQRMCEDEKKKLEALSSNELTRIEQSISVSQANAKQLENYEVKRVLLQKQAGFDGLSFRQLIAAAPEEEQSNLWKLFTGFEGKVAEIRFYNDKSMAVARDNMVKMDPGGLFNSQGGKPSNPYEKFRKEENENNNMLETKA